MCSVSKISCYLFLQGTSSILERCRSERQRLRGAMGETSTRGNCVKITEAAGWSSLASFTG